MSKKIIALAAIALSAAVIVPAFAQTTTPPVSTGNGGSSTITTKIACVGAAVNAREQALDAGYSTYASAMNAAYQARATALSQAYQATSSKQVWQGTHAAWVAFDSAAKSAGEAWKSTRTGAWSTFDSAAAACKASATVTSG